jgi:putative chitinase
MATLAQLQKLAPGGKPEILGAIAELAPVLAEKYGINTPLRMAHFLAQTAHESGEFKVVEENLNYKTTALTAMFGSRITAEQAGKVGRNDATGQKADQAAIANIIYGGAWGAKNLGNTEEGDGAKFKGRGVIQLTGRANYTSFAKAKGISVDEAAEYLKTPQGAVESAAWFWSSRGLNALADSDDITAVTKKVNGGTLGIDHRTELLNKAKSVLG